MIYQVRQHCSLELPNLTVWAREGEWIEVPDRNPIVQEWVRDQMHKLRESTREERVAGVELVPVPEEYLSRFRRTFDRDGFKSPRDGMISTARGGRSKVVVK